MADKEVPKKDDAGEKNAATRFGLEDHEANAQDARVTTLRTDHARRSSMMTMDSKKHNKSTSRIMSVNDAWSITRTPEGERESEELKRESQTKGQEPPDGRAFKSDDNPQSTTKSQEPEKRVSKSDDNPQSMTKSQEPEKRVSKSDDNPQSMTKSQEPEKRVSKSDDNPQSTTKSLEPEKRESKSDDNPQSMTKSLAPEKRESKSDDNPQSATLALSKSASKFAPESETLKTVQPAYDADTSGTESERYSPVNPVPAPVAMPMLPLPLGIVPDPVSETDAEFKMLPPKERPQDIPMAPPIMMPITPNESRALEPECSADDVQSALSKLTNTDVTYNPSKNFATKGTNTSATMIVESDAEPDEEASMPESCSDSDLKSLFLLACREVKAAGDIAREYNEKKPENAAKSQEESESDPDNNTDNLVESTFIDAISSRYPDHIFITGDRIAKSETGFVTLTEKPTWIIDPIDGAMNYAHHFPYYCMSVAYLVDKQTEFGIIYNPPMKNMYTAQRGKGAMMNNTPIRTTSQGSLSSALVLQEFGTEGKEQNSGLAMENAQRLAKVVHAMRSIGSPVMGLAMVASGVADAYFNFGLHIWHMAAGVLLVTEAGGAVVDPAGGELDIMSRRCLVASTDSLAGDLSSRLEQCYPSPRDDERKPDMNDFTSQTDFPETESSEHESK